MSLVLSSLVLSLLALLLGRYIGRRNPARASALTSGMMLLILFSPLLLLLPKLSIPLPWLRITIASSEATNTEPGWSAQSSLSLIWAIGVLSLLLRFYLHHRAVRKLMDLADRQLSQLLLRQLETAAASLAIKTPRIAISSEVSSPIVAGTLRPIILLPEQATSWSSTTLRMVLLHELGHIARRDTFFNYAAHLCCSLHWFNPLVWQLKKRLAHECEFAVDARIIDGGADPKLYISALCDVAATLNNKTLLPSVALAMADRATLRHRVENLLASTSPQSPLLVALILTGTLSTTLAFSILRPQNPITSTTYEEQSAPRYTVEEIELRHSASPFPLD